MAARLIEAGTSGGLVAGAPPVGFVEISVLAGLVEEPGWRGYAQDALQRRHPVLGASLVVGVVWSAWHLPLFLIDGTYQHTIGLGTAGLWPFTAAIPVQAVIYAWIYNATNGSIFSVVLFHTLQDVAGEVFSLEGAERTELVIWAVLAAVVALGSARSMLSRRAPARGRQGRMGGVDRVGAQATSSRAVRCGRPRASAP